jgi:hypothetical protein
MEMQPASLLAARLRAWRLGSRATILLLLLLLVVYQQRMLLLLGQLGTAAGLGPPGSSSSSWLLTWHLMTVT